MYQAVTFEAVFLSCISIHNDKSSTQKLVLLSSIPRPFNGKLGEDAATMSIVEIVGDFSTE